MFSLKVVDTDAFLDMPQTAQNLYFHLSMRADDDGFVDKPKQIMKTVGSGEDDMKVLVAKRFIIPFESGVCVIKHWRIHNLIRQDRYVSTTYLDEKSLLEIKENGSYTELNRVIPNDNQSGAQVRVGKDRLLGVPQEEVVEEKENTEESLRGRKDTSYLQVYESFNAIHGKWPQNWKSNRTQIQAAKNLLEERGLEEIESAIKWYKDLKHLNHCYDVSTPWDLDSKWKKFEEFVEKNS